ncbi:unnamed protein product [Thlaspi arvense]|uniref:Uncharacterized protein n=1 Tax=Thlaspi arvense TaxID=13288 RepID=A0AAU9RLK4_THLAR|nr:unnamed protein product [Thlaspi arvense]
MELMRPRSKRTHTHDANINGDSNGNDIHENGSDLVAINWPSTCTPSKKSGLVMASPSSEATIPADTRGGCSAPSSFMSQLHFPLSLHFAPSLSTVQDALGRWRKKVEEATRRAEDLAGNTWQHSKLLKDYGTTAMR